MTIHRSMDDDTKAWVKHVAWSAFSACVTAIATKLVEMAAEEIKTRRAAARSRKGTTT